MDPSTIPLILTVISQLLELISWASNTRWARSRKTLHAELQLFRTQLDEYLQYVTAILREADAVGFVPTSLEILLGELREFLSSANSLFNNKGCKKADIQELQGRVMTTLQYRMTCALIQMQSRSLVELKAMKEMMANEKVKQGMMSKRHDVHITIFQDQARGNPELTGPLSFVRSMPNPTETLLELFSRFLASGVHSNLVAPTEASEGYKAGAGMIEKSKQSGRWMNNVEGEDVLEDAGNNVLEEEETTNKKRKETLLKDRERLGQRTTKLKESGAGKDVPEKEEEEKKSKKRKEAVLIRDGAGNVELEGEEKRNEELMEKQGQRATELKNDEEFGNLNHNMELRTEEGKGELLVSKYDVSQFKLTYEGCGKSMRMVTGERPMEVSKKLGYFYFEVKLVEMAELAEGRDTCFTGVGVGLARMDKFRTSKVAGKYSKSCGYDGQTGEVRCESTVHRTKMGFLAKEDTLGIGLLQHHGRNTIFFVKNGALQLCIQDQDHTLCAPSRHRGLYPVISLASAYVELHVDFLCPSHISELVARVKATLP